MDKMAVGKKEQNNEGKCYVVVLQLVISVFMEKSRDASRALVSVYELLLSCCMFFCWQKHFSSASTDF